MKKIILLTLAVVFMAYGLSSLALALAIVFIAYGLFRKKEGAHIQKDRAYIMKQIILINLTIAAVLSAYFVTVPVSSESRAVVSTVAVLENTNPTTVMEKIVGFPIRGILTSLWVNTKQMPRIYISWVTPLFGNKHCIYFDASRYDELPRDEMNLYELIYGYIIPTFGSPPLTKEEEAAHCYGGLIPKPWHVKADGVLLYRYTFCVECFLKDGTWKVNGRVTIKDTICDTNTVRKTAYHSYHEVTNDAGKQGLVSCVQ